jgi:hypothetical protein
MELFAKRAKLKEKTSRTTLVSNYNSPYNHNKRAVKTIQNSPRNKILKMKSGHASTAS